MFNKTKTERPMQHAVFTEQLEGSMKKHHNQSMQDTLQTGTTTVAFLCKDCVIMAADKRATAGHTIVDKRVEKVRPITKNMVVTIAGNVSDIQLLLKYLIAEVKLKTLRTNRESNVKEVANLLSGWVYNIIRSSYGIAHFLLGGYDEKPRLYDIYPDGAITEVDDYVVSGSGSDFAMGVLEAQYKKNLTQEEGVALVVKAINAALARDSASGNGIDVYVITKDGAKKVLTKTVNSTVE